MRKMLDVVGLPVLDISSGKKAGTVKDCFFNRYGELKGLAVEKEGIFNKLAYLDFNEIGAIGDDAVTIGSEKSLTPIQQHIPFDGFHSGKHSYKDLPIITTNGYELGHISDVYFKEELGKIIGYEISDGFLSDITEGRRTIQIPNKFIVGEDALIIPNSEVKDVIFGQE